MYYFNKKHSEDNSVIISPAVIEYDLGREFVTKRRNERRGNDNRYNSVDDSPYAKRT